MAKIRPGVANGRYGLHPKKKTAKIHDFRSVLREKIDLIETLKIGVFQCGFREKKILCPVFCFC